jgi:hypothetical protein
VPATSSDEHPVALLPCPFCGAGTFRIDRSRHWTGMRYQTLSVSLRHWCEKDDAALNLFIDFRSKSLDAAVASWNARATKFKAIATDQVLVPGTCTINHWCGIEGSCNGYPRMEHDKDLYPGEGHVGR